MCLLAKLCSKEGELDFGSGQSGGAAAAAATTTAGARGRRSASATKRRVRRRVRVYQRNLQQPGVSYGSGLAPKLIAKTINGPTKGKRCTRESSGRPFGAKFKARLDNVS